MFEKLQEFGVRGNPDGSVRGGIDIVDALNEKSGFLKSNGEARRALKENSISINKEKVNEDFALSENDLIANQFILMQRGKRNYFLLKVS